MHNTTFKNPVHLVHKDRGTIRTFDGIERVYKNWATLQKLDIGPNFKIEYTPREWEKTLRHSYRRRVTGGRLYTHIILPPTHHEYILRDSCGDNINPDTLADRFWKEHHKVYAPYLPGRKRNCGHSLRRIKTTQEIRMYHAWDDEEFAPKGRAARSPKNLPNAWDDIPRTDLDDRSWKKYRKTQRKP